MTTPAQAPARRVEMIVEEIVRCLVVFGFSSEGPRTGGRVELGTRSNWPASLPELREAWAVANYAVMMLAANPDKLEEIVDRLTELGWHARFNSLYLTIEVGSP